MRSIVVDGGWGIVASILTFLVTLVLIPIVAHLFKRNEKMHDINQAALAKHSEALAILIEQSKTNTRTSEIAGNLVTEVAKLTVVIEGMKPHE